MHKSNLTLLIILSLGILRSMFAGPALSYESVTPSNSLSPPTIVDSNSGKLHFSKAEQDWLSQNHVVHVRVGDYAPIQLFNKTPSGIAVDYLNAIAEKIGIHIEYQREINWADTLNKIRDRKGVDLLLGAMSTEERRKYLIFTEIYLSFPSVIFTREDSDFISSLRDLSGKIVAVQNKVVVHNLLIEKYPDLKLLLKDTEKDALQSLVTGESDAYVGNLTVGSFYIQSNGWNNVKVAAPTGFDPQNLSMAVRSDWPELAQIINKTLTTFTPVDHAKLKSQWSAPIRYEYGIHILDIVKWVVGISSILLVIIAIIFWWNKKLAREIVARKKGEKALQESEQEMRSIFRAAPTGIGVVCDRVIQQINDRFCEMMGYSKNELIGQNAKVLYPSDEEYEYVGKEKYKQISKKGTGTVETKMLRKDGNLIDVLLSSTPIDLDDLSKGVTFTALDITERKQMEEEREKLHEEVLKARKLESLGTLAGGIAHDLNNLLFAVMGNISLAEYDLKPEIGTSESLKEAEKACIKAKELSARLITFSKGGDPVKKMMSINDLLKDTVMSALSGSNIKPAISISDDIRQVNIDEGQIKQVVSNIVANAKEAMDDNGQLTVSCENIEIAEEGHLTLSQGEYIKISFADQGSGISKENLKKIFDPYFSTKDMGADKGQGLGLTVSYSIIQKHGGLINVESEPGTGSIFSVYLPTASAKESDFQKPEEKPAAQKPVKQPATGTGKILLMDDEEAIRTFLGQALTRSGYDVETCIEGKEAVEIYKKAMESEDPFDVAILDLTNKIGMGGQETMRRLLEIDPDVKGIVITGYSDDPVVADFRAYSFSGSLTKPATGDELSKVINEVLSKDL